MPKAPRSKKFHHPKPRGLNYAKSLVLDKKIKVLDAVSPLFRGEFTRFFKEMGKVKIRVENVSRAVTAYIENGLRV